MAVTEGTVDTAVGVVVAMMTPSSQAKTVPNALRNKGRTIIIDRWILVF